MEAGPLMEPEVLRLLRCLQELSRFFMVRFHPEANHTYNSCHPHFHACISSRNTLQDVVEARTEIL